MLIRPISTISYNRTQPAFAGKKDEKIRHNNTIVNTMKAIPLATVLAMSPLNNAQAQDLPKVIKLDWVFNNPDEKVLYKKTFPGAYIYDSHLPLCDNQNGITFYTLSNDGDNSDFEVAKAELTASNLKLKRKLSENGKMLEVNAKQTYTYTINKLKEVETKLPTSPYIGYEFYIVGPEVIKTEYKLPDGGSREEYTYNDEVDIELPVSEEFFDAISEILADKVKTETISDPDITPADRLLNIFE